MAAAKEPPSTAAATITEAPSRRRLPVSKRNSCASLETYTVEKKKMKVIRIVKPLQVVEKNEKIDSARNMLRQSIR
jgi:hypothetical protein